jgi:DNA-binding Xre family transcriptional regulator
MARWRVREIAEQKGFNAHQLSLAAQLSYNTVRPIWNGEAKRADLETLSRIAAVLGVSPGDLIGNGPKDSKLGNSKPDLVAA